MNLHWFRINLWETTSRQLAPHTGVHRMVYEFSATSGEQSISRKEKHLRKEQAQHKSNLGNKAKQKGMQGHKTRVHVNNN